MMVTSNTYFGPGYQRSVISNDPTSPTFISVDRFPFRAAREHGPPTPAYDALQDVDRLDFELSVGAGRPCRIVGPEDIDFRTGYEQQELRESTGIGILAVEWTVCQEYLDGQTNDRPERPVAIIGFDDGSTWSHERFMNVLNAIHVAAL